MREDSVLRRLPSKAVVLAGMTMMMTLCFSGRDESFRVRAVPSLSSVEEDQETVPTVREGAGDYEDLRVETIPSSSSEEPLAWSAAGDELLPVAEEALWSDTASPEQPVVVAADLIKRAKRYHPIIMKAAYRHQVDPALVKAVIMAESAYDPRAVSSEGASGLMQLMPKTAEALGIEDPFNAEHNVNGGVKYLKQLLDEFNDDIEMALAAYCLGSGTIRRHQGIPPTGDIRSYIEKVFIYYRLFRDEADPQADGA